MEIEHFFVEDFDNDGGVFSSFGKMLEKVLLGLKVDVVGGVDGLGDAVDLMGGGETTAELGVVLDVVDAGEGMSWEEEGEEEEV